MSEQARDVIHIDKEQTMPERAQSRAVTPLDMIDRALASNATPETLERLLALQERYEANQARKAFDEAVANAKAKIPPIIKNRKGHGDKRYVDFAAIATVVDPIISDFGLSYRFRTRQDDKIHVTCILSHRDGHSEETTLSGPADTSGSKNAIQAIGSTLQYLQRYSLTQALGLATAEDDDGHAAGLGETITDKQRDELLALLSETKSDVARFCKVGKVESVGEIKAADFDAAKAMLLRKKREMEAERNGDH